MSDWPDDLDALIKLAVGDARDPYPDYAWARREDPVMQQDPAGAWFTIFRYADVERMLRDPQTFSSRGYEDSVGLAFGPSILQMDGAEHQQHRALIGGTFRRRAIERVLPTLIEPTIHDLIDRIAGHGRAELVSEVTIRYPIQIIAELLGIPREEYPRFVRLSIAMLGLSETSIGLQAAEEMRSYLAPIVEQRRRDPREDLISELAGVEIDGRPLPDEEIFGFLRLLLPAGAETTYRLLGSLLFALLHDPRQLYAVRDQRDLLPAAIEEALRWETPVQFIERMTTRDVEVGAAVIPAGAHIGLVLGSANRDEAVFEDPDRYDLFAVRAPHLAFAEGPHRCLGEHLARAEVTTAMNALLDRLEDLRLDADGGETYIQGDAFRSPNRLPVRFRPARVVASA